MSYRRVELLRSTVKILKFCKLTPEERLVIYTDTWKNRNLVDAFYAAAISLGSDPILVTVSPKEMMEGPPKLAVGLMKSADIIIDLPTNPWLYSKATNEILDSGARMLQVLASEAAVARRPPTEDLIRRAEMGATLFKEAGIVRITSGGHTDLTMHCEGRPGWGQDGVVRNPCEWDSATTSIIAVAPLETMANGRLVIAPGDTVYFHPHKLVVSRPINIQVEEGSMTKIEGETEAQLIESWLKSFNDPNSYVIAHTGFGGDARATVASMDAGEWESIAGGINVAFGSNIFRGLKGANAAKSHIDIVICNATMYIDDEIIIKDGKFAHRVLV